MPLSQLLGEQVIAANGAVVNVADIAAECKLIGIYFSAHWCPPCKGFTPVLAEWYKNQKEAGAQLEIVFVSSDRDQASFDGYFGSMPWKAVAFSERDLKGELGDKFSVRGIPTLVFVDENGKEITKDGRNHVTKGDSVDKIRNSPRESGSSEGSSKCIMI